MAETSERIHRAFIVVNCAYLVLGIILISISAVAMQATPLLTTPVVGGFAATGIFLLLLAILGIVGVVMANQALVFFYLVFMCVTCFIQFCVAIACLTAFNKARRTDVLLSSWEEASNVTIQDVQKRFHCCGFDQSHVNYTCCEDQQLTCCSGLHNCTTCNFCIYSLDYQFKQAVRCTGGVGLLFGFLQVGGIMLAWWYRRQPSLGFGHDILN